MDPCIDAGKHSPGREPLNRANRAPEAQTVRRMSPDMASPRDGGTSWTRPALALAATCAVAFACGATELLQRAPSSPSPSTPTAGSAAPPATCPGEPGEDGATSLERAVRDAVQGAGFDEVIDLGPTDDPVCPGDSRCVSGRIAHVPSVDVAVIAFPPGCPPAFANVMLSRDAPEARVNGFDPETLAIRGVRLLRWDQARWDDTGPGTAPPGEGDFVVPPGEASVDFVVPYPASNFKLMVAVKVLELVDREVIGLEDRFTHARRTRSIREWLADMITWSDDESTQALLRRLHAIGEADRIDALFARLGLSTLQIHDTSAATGRNWQPGRIHMSAWDTARLLWLLDPDAPPPSWRAPGGAPVDAGFLRPGTKALLLGLLGEQRFHDVLSTTALCGRPGTEPGIPALLPARWIGDDGRVGAGEGMPPGADVRPCNERAEVTFAHKTGLTLNFGSDAGIVRGIPGRARRHYIIAFFSNLGHRYTDPDKLAGPHPCHHLGICYTQRIASMARAIDGALASAIEAP
jgi:hypothetical protein